MDIMFAAFRIIKKLSSNMHSFFSALPIYILRPTAKGFTLIEILVVISVIGILVGVGFSSFRSAQASARDAKRKSDLESIRSVLEIYRQDCGVYPESLPFGQHWQASCPGEDTSRDYGDLPQDPIANSDFQYVYVRENPHKYKVCARLERGENNNMLCAGLEGIAFAPPGTIPTPTTSNPTTPTPTTATPTTTLAPPPTTTTPTPPPTTTAPSPSPSSSPSPAPTITYTSRILLVIYNPTREQDGQRQKLTEIKGWNNPDTLTNGLINFLNTYSGGAAGFQIVERVEIDGFPKKTDGFVYTIDTYLNCLRDHSTCHSPDEMDYNAMLSDPQIEACSKRNNNRIDEVWMWGGPWFGFYESRLAGPGAFWYNSTPVTDSTCESLLPIMGFSYERGLDVALESFAHRVEATMLKVYGSWSYGGALSPKYFAELNTWEKFALLANENLADLTTPHKGGCGNAHLAVNAPGTTGYNRDSRTQVYSFCDEFKDNYLNLDPNNTTQVNCETWGCNTEDYFSWWYDHIPRQDTQGPDGKWANWWKYIVKPENAL